MAGRLREINTHLSEPGPERLVPGRELAPLISKVLVGHRAHHSGPKKVLLDEVGHVGDGINDGHKEVVATLISLGRQGGYQYRRGAVLTVVFEVEVSVRLEHLDKTLKGGLDHPVRELPDALPGLGSQFRLPAHVLLGLTGMEPLGVLDRVALLPVEKPFVREQDPAGRRLCVRYRRQDVKVEVTFIAERPTASAFVVLIGAPW